MAGLSANLSEKAGRQVFAEVPGIFVYDMDGSGNQVNISARGLDAHRSWEFNVRQNGVLTTSDVYGYPASHYSAPMEAVERIELIRGTAALQYGSQFGGLLNYVIKAPDTTRRATIESHSSVGSFGLRSTWNAVGGRIGRVSYYGYASLRRSDGYRQNGPSIYDAEYLSASLPLTPTLSVRAEAGRTYYRYQQPGPLTDAMFAVNPQQSTRSRNWYSPDITVPSITLSWTPNASTRSTLIVSGVFGSRSSVAVGGFATAADTASRTGVWTTRQVDVDRYSSRTAEWRLQHDTRLGAWPMTLSGGMAASDNDTHRRQQGVGSRGSDFSLALEPGGNFKRDVHYRTRNLAAHLESAMQITSRWTIVPGVRVERGTTRMSGRLAYYDPTDTPRDIAHRFPLFGVRSSWVLPAGAEWYGGWSQAYRPMILKDVLPETASERTDRSLRDARGWTVESGVRGSVAGGLNYDVGAFVMRYANRFGLLTVTDTTGTPYTYKTNVGTTRTAGLEARVSLPIAITSSVAWRVFSATSLMDARYAQGSVISVGRNADISGNEVESAPRLIARAGLTARGRRGDVTAQFSHVSRTYADALNTVVPSVTGAVGRVPAYTVTDLNGSYALTARWQLIGGVNNVFNTQYFTKRPQFYPGPGVWPSDGRSWQLSVRVRPGTRE
ncbi:MAG TPA: TonB-dependent receptor [Gemmatimonas sp.]|uniref:TonB-dependent receptor family protein n=1 Tax=Gemmatimonas sp. TaxID=1962908 RepID=UPI002ED7D143